MERTWAKGADPAGSKIPMAAGFFGLTLGTGYKRCTGGYMRQKNYEHKKACYLINSRLFNALAGSDWWRFTDSNRGPVDYDSIALTD
jgi:hypothetical protein